jgi:hypothetical protein
MNENTELLSAVAQVVRAFNDLDVEYLIGGSIASSVFGEPRQTIDADIVARLLPRHAALLVKQLSPDFYADLESIVAAIENGRCFNLIHLQTMGKVDVFTNWRRPFAVSQFQRRQKKTVGASDDLLFASPEDTVLAKIEWYRDGGCVSDRQWRDLLGVLKVQAGSLDRAYLAHWAGELGITDLLNRALRDAGIET